MCLRKYCTYSRCVREKEECEDYSFHCKLECQWRDQEWLGADLFLDKTLNHRRLCYSCRCFRNKRFRCNKREQIEAVSQYCERKPDSYVWVLIRFVNRIDSCRIICVFVDAISCLQFPYMDLNQND